MSAVINIFVEGQEAFEWEGSEEEVSRILDHSTAASWRRTRVIEPGAAVPGQAEHPGVCRAHAQGGPPAGIKGPCAGRFARAPRIPEPHSKFHFFKGVPRRSDRLKLVVGRGRTALQTRQSRSSIPSAADNSTVRVSSSGRITRICGEGSG
jgi:hypothetical protein